MRWNFRDMRLVLISELSRYCHPQRKFAKIMFLRVFVSHSIQGGVVSQHAMQVVSQHALQISRLPPGGSWGVWSGGSPCHSQGEVEGSGQRGVSRPTPRGEGVFPGPHLGGVSRPTPRGLQAHTWGCPGPHLRGSQGLHPGGYPSMHWGRHPPADSYCCRQYASYWNAFLSSKCFAIHILRFFNIKPSKIV